MLDYIHDQQNNAHESTSHEIALDERSDDRDGHEELHVRSQAQAGQVSVVKELIREQD